MFETDAEKQARKVREEVEKENHKILMQVNEIITERLKCLFYVLVQDEDITRSYLKGAVSLTLGLLKAFKKELAQDKDTGIGIYSDEKVAKFAQKLANKFLESDEINMKSFSDQLIKKLKLDPLSPIKGKKE